MHDRTYLNATMELASIARALSNIVVSERFLLAKNTGAPTVLTKVRENLETEVRDLLSTHPKLAHFQRASILTSLSSALVTALSPEAPGSIHFMADDWRVFLTTMTPDELRLWSSRGLGIGSMHRTVYDCLKDQVRPKELALDFADAIADSIAPYELATQ
ncbi:hypothetical protein ACOI1H_16420 [Loktanella sp. DJP18]|uniref:hypothetical protein n=1 Tax=Loktanella sp. DJP18 TaxID=3409788 RepID=UPI003BB7677E